MKIHNLTQLTPACPSQWEADTEDGRKVYVRYRWGKLRVGVGDDIDEAVASSRYNYVWTGGGAYSGVMTTKEMLERTGLEVDE